MMSKVKLQAW